MSEALEESRREFEVRELTGSEWDRLNGESPQGSVYSSFVYGRALESTLGLTLRTYGVWDGSTWVAGAMFWESREGEGSVVHAPLRFTPYIGVLMRPDSNELRAVQTRVDAVRALTNRLSGEFKSLTFALHPEFSDIRAFQWYRYSDGGFFRSSAVRYTSILPIDGESSLLARLSTLRRRELRKAERGKLRFRLSVDPGDLAAFLRLYDATFARQEITVREHDHLIISGLFRTLAPLGAAALHFTETPSGDPLAALFLMRHQGTLYYAFGAQDPASRSTGAGTHVFWNALLSQLTTARALDFVGINSPDRGWYKLSFGGSISPYYIVSTESSV